MAQSEFCFWKIFRLIGVHTLEDFFSDRAYTVHEHPEPFVEIVIFRFDFRTFTDFRLCYRTFYRICHSPTSTTSDLILIGPLERVNTK